MLREISLRALRTSSVLRNCKRLGTRRHSHTRRVLPYPVADGLGKFLPPQALRTLEEYQDGLLERLDAELRTDTKAEMHSGVAQIALRYAEQKERTLAFNYAVLAWNNSFFLNNLTPPHPPEKKKTNHQGATSGDLIGKIRHHYGDFPRLKSTFSAAAMGMFTNGWVWMVTDRQGYLGILPTYGPSTLLIRSRTNMEKTALIFREFDPQGTVDPSPSTAPRSASTTTPPGIGPASPASGFSSRPFGLSGSTLDPYARTLTYDHSHSGILENVMKPTNSFLDAEDEFAEDAQGRKDPSGKVLTVGECLFPLFCLPTYEHAWMSAGFGVWGKEEWIKEFWTVLDWAKVSRTYEEVLSRPNK